jgi:hypothetical protein
MVQTPDCAVGRVGEGHEVNSPPMARVSPRESRTPSFGALLQHVKQRVSVFILDELRLNWRQSSKHSLDLPKRRQLTS